MTDEELIKLPDGRTFTAKEYAERLQLLSSPFRPDQLELKPQQVQKGQQPKAKCLPESRQQNVSADGVFCGGYHAWSIHLDYIGHAGIRERLTEVDPAWYWEPMAKTPNGTPLYSDEGMWGYLTVLGITKLGFGDAQGKSGANATKEIIGDFLRNAAMSFGVGTYLWSKSEAAAKKKLGEAEQQIEETVGAQPEPPERQVQEQPAQPPAAPDWDAELKRAWNDLNLLKDLNSRARGMNAPPEFIGTIGQRGMQLEALQAESQQQNAN